MSKIVLVAAVICLLLGGFWLLQGLGALHVRPILCFADCAPVQGPSRTWAISGFLLAFAGMIALLALFVWRPAVTPTVEFDPSREFVELADYKFHVRTFGDKADPPLIVVHGGPGGDSRYLYPLQGLATDYYVIFYDQRGTGLSPRVQMDTMTLESSLNDLHLVVDHYGARRPVRLIGHSWGAMLVVGYLGRHPERVSHAVVVEPGILNPASAKEFVGRFKAGLSVWDALPMLGYMVATPFVAGKDGHERRDYVMTRLMNQSRPGGPYQCAGEAMPPHSFQRAGYAAYANMLKPVLARPETFTQDLTRDVARYKGKLLLLSSECSFIGFHYQREFHLPFLPAQTEHLEAKGMGHNMLTINPAWSVVTIAKFLGEGA
jgi:proline iminopeptidase